MSIGEKYRDLAKKEQDAKQAKQDADKTKATKNLSDWFNDIAKNLPAQLDRAIEAKAQKKELPSLYWDYGFDYYEGDRNYQSTPGFQAFREACKQLDVGCKHLIDENDITMADTRCTTLKVSVKPEEPYAG